VQSSTLRLARFSATANIREVFKNYGCTLAHELYQAFRQHMVAVPPKPSLATRQLFEMPFGAFRAFGLQATAQLKFSFFYLLPAIISIKTAFTISRWRHDSQINTPNFISWLKLGRICLHYNMQPPPLLSVSNQISASIFPAQILAVIFSQFKVQLNSSANRQDSQLVTVKPNRVRLAALFARILHPGEKRSDIIPD
jgi:hypothetical protein